MKRMLALALLFALLPLTVAGPSAQAVGFGRNVEWVGTVPLTNDSAGARLRDGWFYVTTSTALHIYDVSNPLNPKRTGVLPFPQSPQFAQEDPDTNGRILLIASSVIDVSDKANPRVLSTHGGNAHTITCVLDCTWAYASNGVIVDLRDPAKPRTSTSRWTDGMPASSSHDVTEVAPGLVVTSSDPILFLDARRDPEKPVLIGQGPRRGRFTHGNLWPQQGRDRFLLVGGESGGVPGQCTSPSAHLVTMDATQGWPTYDSAGNIEKPGTFTPVGEYRVAHGLPTEGGTIANAWCAHWFDPHPSYADGGLLAMAWYEHGVRMLQVDADGQFAEVGWYVPLAASTSGVYWISDRVMYATDYQRSFDILRYTGPLPAGTS